uniref:Uncharacterized protein n=1 Tax=Daphnia galeata TaxID=27404 RepID=A0A8J2RFY2_9CRUS|nr:unnamed protein product [Daphnia galeata]
MEVPAMDDLGKADDIDCDFQKQNQEVLNKLFYAGTAFVIVCPEQPEVRAETAQLTDGLERSLLILEGATKEQEQKVVFLALFCFFPLHW